MTRHPIAEVRLASEEGRRSLTIAPEDGRYVIQRLQGGQMSSPVSSLSAHEARLVGMVIDVLSGFEPVQPLRGALEDLGVPRDEVEKIYGLEETEEQTDAEERPQSLREVCDDLGLPQPEEGQEDTDVSPEADAKQAEGSPLDEKHRLFDQIRYALNAIMDKAEAPSAASVSNLELARNGLAALERLADLPWLVVDDDPIETTAEARAEEWSETLDQMRQLADDYENMRHLSRRIFEIADRLEALG